MVKKILLSIIIYCLLFSGGLLAQSDALNFQKYQLSFPHVASAWKKYNDTLSKEFYNKSIYYPPKDIYIRVFKSQNELELWARNNESSTYKLIQTFHICALSGILGPKRAKGDNQVPEGFYFIDDFNPQSQYYLSLLLNYPNYADAQYGSSIKLGGDIYIHGGCVTIGCLPMTDEIMKQLYVICLNAKISGQEHIPVHIFPLRFTKNGINFLKKEYSVDADKLEFWNGLKIAYDFFEKTHTLLPVMYTNDGKYVY